LAVACLSLVVLAKTSTAFAFEQANAKTRVEDLYEQASRDDDRLDFARALATYDEVRALDPSSREASLAEARAAVLRDHAEGNFGPLAAVERVRRDPALSSDPNVVDRLVIDAEAFPPGLVRIEAWVLAAEAYARRFHREDDAMKLYQRVVRDPNAPRFVTQSASRDLAMLLAARGDLNQALEETRRAGDRADPNLLEDLTRLKRRLVLERLFVVTLATMMGLSTVAMAFATIQGRAMQVARALSRMTPLIVGFGIYVGVVGGLLAVAYDTGETTATGSARPFLFFGAALTAILLVARAWAAAGSPRKAARVGRALVCAAAAIATAFLVLEHVDVTYLEAVGL